ncbi:hypothetical protein Taro_009088 [Colocasia esculenta]|uniref:Uncharacterized protein n=1 Tax=Colocasia esculenta TaxID=4460 RepID=A0A843U331_COLES|nr:hypothetical protein [Colocasia esculenta]
MFDERKGLCPTSSMPNMLQFYVPKKIHLSLWVSLKLRGVRLSHMFTISLLLVCCYYFYCPCQESVRARTIGVVVYWTVPHRPKSMFHLHRVQNSNTFDA